MKHKPQISVIMSVYNGMPFLKLAVESILHQTYENFEFIVVDDGSKDQSWSYLISLNDTRIKLMKNEENLGLAASLNKALKVAKGAYIARMDADDISSPSRLKEQIDFLKDHRVIDLCGTWANIIDERGKGIGQLQYPTNSDEIIKKIFLFNPIIHPSLMARKSFYKKLSGYREEYDGAEDYDLLVRGISKFKYSNLPKKLIYLRLSSSRRSVKAMGKMDKLDLKIKIGLLKENGLSRIGVLAILKKMFFIWVIPAGLKVQMINLLKRSKWEKLSENITI